MFDFLSSACQSSEDCCKIAQSIPYRHSRLVPGYKDQKRSKRQKGGTCKYGQMLITVKPQECQESQEKEREKREEKTAIMCLFHIISPIINAALTCRGPQNAAARFPGQCAAALLSLRLRLPATIAPNAASTEVTEPPRSQIGSWRIELVGSADTPVGQGFE